MNYIPCYYILVVSISTLNELMNMSAEVADNNSESNFVINPKNITIKIILCV